MKNEESSFLGQNFRKIITILIGLVLIVSGLIITTIPVGAGTRGARQDLDTLANDFDPNVVINNIVGNIYLNNETLTLELEVYDEDDVHNATHDNGTQIVSVTVNLTAFGMGDAEAMTYQGNGTMDPNTYNSTRQEGVWTYDLPFDSTMFNYEPGNYTVYFNVTDSGDNGTGLSPRWTEDSYEIKLGQHNRAPQLRGGAQTSYIAAEDEWSDWPLMIDLNDIFIDADVEGGTYNNTTPDSLTMEFQDATGTWFDTESVTPVWAIYDGFVVMSGYFIPDHYIWIGSIDNASTPGPVIVNVSATDNHMEQRIQALTIRINAVNDPPIINMSKDWTFNETSTAIPADMYNITGEQGGYIGLHVNITDSDSMDFTYEIKSWNLTGIHTTTPPFTIEEDTGNISFTPGNNHVGQFTALLNVSDGYLYDEENITFIIANVNDDAMLEWANNEDIIDHAASITGLDTRATQDQLFNLWVRAKDIDLDIGETDTLTFGATSDQVTITDEGKLEDGETGNFSFTPNNADALRGWVHVNVTVKDATGTAVDDWAMINISVANVNDLPYITMVNGVPPPASGIKDMGTIKTTDKPVKVLIEAGDIDKDTLTCSAAAENGTANAVTNATGGWDVTYTPPTTPGEDTVTVTVSDGKGGTDMVYLTWTIEEGFVNQNPTITITTEAGQKIEIGKNIVIEGTWSDPDGDDVTILVAYTTAMDVAMGGGGEPSDWDYVEDENITVNTDGTWSLVASTKEWKKMFDDMKKAAEALGLSIPDSYLYGTYTFYFKAVDENDGESSPASISVEITKAPTEDEDEEAAGLDMMMMSIIIIIIIVIIIVVAVVMMKKKKKPEEEAPPEEAAVPPPEVACPQCGTMIPPGSETCPGCGAPAPPPAPPMEEEAAAPPTEMACPACGAMIPAGYPTCPACGAPAPPPAPPAEMEGEMPPEQPPAEMEGEMPPEQPPAEMEGEMPPEQPPEMPPEQPPAGTAACPTCGAQLAVGTTPCPSCGTGLNW